MTDRYKFKRDIYFDTKGNTIAVSSYAGKPVKGVAKCSPNDAFDEATGIRLAELRCGMKVAKKRMDRATRKYSEACDALDEAQSKVEDMLVYYTDAYNELNGIIEEYNKLMEDLGD